MQQRLAATLANPRRADAAVVEHFKAALAAGRSTEDTLGAAFVIRPTLVEVTMLKEIAPHALEPILSQLVNILAEYAQFAGWMSTDLNLPVEAHRWYEQAMEWAQETGNTNMVASILSMKSHEAWSRGEIHRARGLARAAIRLSPETSPGVRSLFTQQAARAAAMAKDKTGTERLLDLAQTLAERAVRNLHDEPTWVYFHSPERVSLQRGVAYTELGDGRKAVAAIEQGIAALPEQFVRDRAWGLARLATAHAIERDVDAAVGAATAALQVTAEGLDSAHTLTEIRKARSWLAPESDTVAVRQLDELLHDLRGGIG